MPGGFQISSEYCNAQSLGTSQSTGGVAVVGGNTVPGSWTTIIASTTYDIDILEVVIFPTNSTSQLQLWDIAVGGAGSEVIIAQQLLGFSNTNNNAANKYLFPCTIPAGSRIAARSANSAAADTSWLKVNGFSGSFGTVEGAAGIEALAVSGIGGVSLADATGGAKGVYTQIIAATARDYIGFMTSFHNSSTGAKCLTDLAIGGSGSEIIIIPDIPNSATVVNMDICGPYYVPVPSGTRIAARFNAITGSTSLTQNIVVYGIYQ